MPDKEDVRLPSVIDRLISTIYALPAILLAFTLHEFSHAFTADRLGDPTPRNMGRITLNPARHIDWMGLIMIALLGFGWARPVQINISNFKNRRLGDVLVSVAGPLVNLLLAITFLGIYIASIMLWKVQADWFYNILWPFVSLNFILFLFNLLPVPPLDGYHVVKSLFMRGSNFHVFSFLDQYGMIILIAFILLLNYTGWLGALQFWFMDAFGGLFTRLFGG